MKFIWLIINNFLGFVFAISSIGWLVYFFYNIKDINPLPAVALAALSGVFFTNSYQIKNTMRQQSEFYLNSVIDGFKEAYNMLNDGNNNRVKWVNAARTLNTSVKLSLAITEKEHREVLENKILNYRICFSEILGADNKEKSGAFFYGAKDLSISIDQASKESTKPDTVGNVFIASTLKEIPEESLYEIWKLAEFKEGYVNNNSQTFTDGDLLFIEIKYPGLFEYLQHKRKYHSAGGKLYSNSKDCLT